MINQTTETREVVTQTPSGAVRETVAATNDPAARGLTAAQIVDLITSALLAVLAIRFGLSLLGANQANAFANLIYSVSYPLVAPFFGLFGYTVRYGVARFEIETLVAIAVYGLVGYGIARMMAIGRARM